MKKFAKIAFYRYNIKRMEKREKIVAIVSILTFVALLCGLAFLFLGSGVVRGKPGAVTIQNVGDETYVVADYSGQYGYKFKIEQFMQDEFITVGSHETTNNTLKLSDTNIDLSVGKVYRFSVCYTIGNGLGNSDFSSPVEWYVTEKLSGVDLSTVSVLGDELSWSPVNNADAYQIKIVDETGNIMSGVIDEASIDISPLLCGEYSLFITPMSASGFYVSPQENSAWNLTIEKANAIDSAIIDSGTLIIACSQKVEKVSLYFGGELTATVGCSCESDGDVFICRVTNCGSILAKIDGSNKLSIKTLKAGHVLESALFEI